MKQILPGPDPLLPLLPVSGTAAGIQRIPVTGFGQSAAHTSATAWRAWRGNAALEPLSSSRLMSSKGLHDMMANPASGEEALTGECQDRPGRLGSERTRQEPTVGKSLHLTGSCTTEGI